MDLAEVLNPEQYRAATTLEGPLLILAGAGSGKTRVLVHRIAHMLDTGATTPWQIFAVTFTNKAAGEMKHRLEDLVGASLGRAWIGTFHSLCARLLRIEGKRLGYDQSFTIYDQDDAKRLLKRIMEEMGIDSSRGTSVSGVANEIDRAKNRGLTPKRFAEDRVNLELPTRKIARAVYPKYQRALARSNAMDFGDLLLLAVELLKHHPEVRKKWSQRFTHVMVDEFQDTNAVQYGFLKLLVDERCNLAVVGDDDQSIYRWRGADVTNILGFTKDFPGATVVKLEENYRSTANILEAANAVIARNIKRHDKQLRTDAGPGEPVGVALFRRGEEEAEVVAQLIEERIGEGADPEDFAVLYRTNAQSRLFEESLKRLRVPYTLVGGTGFYDRMEVKDIVAYLRLTANPASSQDFERVVNTPARKIGKKTVERLRTAASTAGISGAHVLDLDAASLRAAGLPPATIQKLKKLSALLADFRDLAGTADAADVARVIVDRVGYEAHLRHADPASADDRFANVAELVSSIAEFEQHLEEEEEAATRTPLSRFLEQAALATSEDRNTDAGSVSLLTLHSAKGLEFPVVFMVGMEERTFPSLRAIEGDPDAMEEERRLCYVGMTRAQRALYLSAARYRRIFGTEEVRRASRFLGELPNDIVGNMPLPRRRGRFSEGTPATGRMRSRPVIDRGDDRIEYDEVPPAPGAAPPADLSDITVPGDGFAIGVRVHHNTFGVGTVEQREGSGKKTLLRIRFPNEPGVKTVAARFVSLAKES